MKEQNKKPQCKDKYIKVTGWEIIDINRKLDFLNFLIIILVLLEVIQIFL